MCNCCPAPSAVATARLVNVSSSVQGLKSTAPIVTLRPNCSLAIFCPSLLRTGGTASQPINQSANTPMTTQAARRVHLLALMDCTFIAPSVFNTQWRGQDEKARRIGLQPIQPGLTAAKRPMPSGFAGGRLKSHTAQEAMDCFQDKPGLLRQPHLSAGTGSYRRTPDCSGFFTLVTG